MEHSIFVLNNELMDECGHGEMTELRFASVDPTFQFPFILYHDALCFVQTASQVIGETYMKFNLTSHDQVTEDNVDFVSK